MNQEEKHAMKSTDEKMVSITTQISHGDSTITIKTTDSVESDENEDKLVTPMKALGKIPALNEISDSDEVEELTSSTPVPSETSTSSDVHDEDNFEEFLRRNMLVLVSRAIADMLNGLQEFLLNFEDGGTEEDLHTLAEGVVCRTHGQKGGRVDHTDVIDLARDMLLQLPGLIENSEDSKERTMAVSLRGGYGDSEDVEMSDYTDGTDEAEPLLNSSTRPQHGGLRPATGSADRSQGHREPYVYQHSTPVERITAECLARREREQRQHRQQRLGLVASGDSYGASSESDRRPRGHAREDSSHHGPRMPRPSIPRPSMPRLSMPRLSMPRPSMSRPTIFSNGNPVPEPTLWASMPGRPSWQTKRIRSMSATSPRFDTDRESTPKRPAKKLRINERQPHYYGYTCSRKDQFTGERCRRAFDGPREYIEHLREVHPEVEI